MALILTCPHCAAKLKTRQRIACGDPATCPKCTREFIAADIVEESTRPDLPPVLPASHPQSALPVREEPKPQRTRRAEPDEKPSSRDEEMIAARYQWRGDSEPPPSRSRDEDDDRPSSRRTRYDDDRPARDPGDSSDRTRSRRAAYRRGRRRRGKNRNVLYFALSFGGALALMGIVLLIVHLAGNTGADEQMLACLPADTNMITGVDFDVLANKPGPLGLIDEFKWEEAGLARGDIDKIIVAKSENSGPIIVVRLKSSFNKTRFLDYTRADERRENGKVYYQLRREPGPAFAWIDSDSLLMLAEKEDPIRDLLRRDRSKPVVSASMQELVNTVSSGSIWVATTSPNGGAGLFGGGLDGDVRGFGMSAKLSGDEMEFKLTFMTGGSDSAQRMQDRLQSDLDREKRRLDDELRNSRRPSDRHEDNRALLLSASVQRDGSLVTITGRGKNPWGERGGGGGGGGRDLFQMFR